MMKTDVDTLIVFFVFELDGASMLVYWLLSNATYEVMTGSIKRKLKMGMMPTKLTMKTKTMMTMTTYNHDHDDDNWWWW
jgi:hypothetical protein